jgi:hypothetical protein
MENTNMTSRIETALRVTIVAAFGVFALVLLNHRAALAAPHPADPTAPADLAILTATGDTVDGRTIRNTCNGIVHPTISRPATDMAIVIESDPTGACVGSSPPSSLTILLMSAKGWRPEAGFPASTYRLGPIHAGRPDVIAAYAPFHHDCPVMTWDGRHYQISRTCPDWQSR